MQPWLFAGLIQIQNLPLLTATSANKMTSLHVGTSYTHNIGFHNNRNALATYMYQIAWPVRGCATFKPPLVVGSPFKILPVLYLGQRVAENPSTFLPIFMGLSLTPITNFITLGTYSQLHRGQMSHTRICDISPLKLIMEHQMGSSLMLKDLFFTSQKNIISILFILY